MAASFTGNFVDDIFDLDDFVLEDQPFLDYYVVEPVIAPPSPDRPAGGGRLTTRTPRPRRAIVAPTTVRVPFALRIEVGGAAHVVVRWLRTVAQWDRLDWQDLEEL